ncbi:MAG: GNAT family N-acetyltransferase [Planctomycetota bacterium]
MPQSSIREARPGDESLIRDFILELAEYERLGHEAHPDIDRLRDHLFGAHPVCEAVIAEKHDSDAREPIGFALFFTNYSTFETAPGLYLEDLFVRESARGLGIGRALLTHLAQVAVDRNYRRFDWSVLDWNESAIGFYRALGARVLDDWRTCRLEGEALQQLGARK